VKNIGKPCAGKPHARFDEGGQAQRLLSTLPVQDSLIGLSVEIRHAHTAEAQCGNLWTNGPQSTYFHALLLPKSFPMRNTAQKKQGERVSFDEELGPKGPQAIKVVKLD